MVHNSVGQQFGLDLPGSFSAGLTCGFHPAAFWDWMVGDDLITCQEVGVGCQQTFPSQSLMFKEASLSFFTMWKHWKGRAESPRSLEAQVQRLYSVISASFYWLKQIIRADSSGRELDSTNGKSCKEFYAIFNPLQIARNKSNKGYRRLLHRK